MSRAALAVRIGAVALLAAGVCEVARVASSEWLQARPTAANLARALKLAPDNAYLHAALGRLLELDGADPRPAFRRAVALHPRDSLLWLRLGLAEENAGDLPAAERALLAAARASRKHDVRWTLANFYYRRRQPEQFFHWARQALEMAWSDSTPLFDLAWRLESDPRRIEERLLVPRRDVRINYAVFLLDTSRTQALAPVARDLAALALPAERAFFVRLVNTLLDRGETALVLELWPTLQRRLLTAPPPAPDVARFAFEWRAASAPGLRPLELRPQTSWRFELTGHQPERCPLLERVLALTPQRQYRLEWSTEPPWRALAAAGFAWEISTVEAAPRLLARSDSRETFLRLPPADRPACLRVALLYQRPPGLMRYEGAVAVTHAAWREAP